MIRMIFRFSGYKKQKPEKSKDFSGFVIMSLFAYAGSTYKRQTFNLPSSRGAKSYIFKRHSP